MTSIEQKINELIELGYSVGGRNPKAKPGFEGRFMVADPLDDEDGFCIVGDELSELVDEAYAFITGRL